MLLTDNRAMAPCWNVLVLCTGNSARSVLAEAIFNYCAGGWFRSFSAGSQPTGRVNPFALRELAARGIESSDFRSKNWREFTGSEAPRLDVLLTVCDSAAAEVCPAFAGDYEHVHWGLPDPAAAEEALKPAAFAQCFTTLRQRVETLVQMPLGQFSRSDLARAMRQLAGSEQLSPMRGDS